MKEILRHHLFMVLAGFAGMFLVLIAGFYWWGIGYLMGTTGQASSNQSGQLGSSAFNISGAQKLDYRGTLQQ